MNTTNRVSFLACIGIGDQLRSVSQICASFGLARNTVQAALNKLEAAGYIKTEQRKMASIVYQGRRKTSGRMP